MADDDKAESPSTFGLIVQGVKDKLNDLSKTYNPIRAVTDALTGEKNTQSVWPGGQQGGRPEAGKPNIIKVGQEVEKEPLPEAK